MTVSEGQPTLSVDPEASLRAELLGTIAGAQFDIDNAIAELARSGADASALTNQRQSLQQLHRQVGTANLTTLAGLRTEIAGAVATTQTLAEQGRAIATTAGQAAAEALATASANSRAQVTSIMRDMHRFDPYLHFASAEDEAAYRKHEAERLAYINAQHAKGTAEGNLNAAGAALGQLADAKAHGAGDSPEFERKNAELAKSADQLREALRANGGSTKEFDDRMREDTRAILRNKGLSQAQVDAHLAAHAESPIEGIVSIAPPSAASSAPTQPQKATTTAATSQPDDIADIAAALKAAGVVSASPNDTSKVSYKTAHADRNVAKDGRC